MTWCFIITVPYSTINKYAFSSNNFTHYKVPLQFYIYFLFRKYLQNVPF